MSTKNLDRSQLTQVLGKELQSLIKDWVPEMVKNLPDQLLENVEADDLVLQARALLLLQKGELDQELVLSNSHRNRITVIASENRTGFLAGLLQRLPKDKPLVRAQIFSSLDRRFIIDIFDFSDELTRAAIEPLPPEIIQNYVNDVAQRTGASTNDVQRFLNAIGAQNRQYSLEILANQFLSFDQVMGSDRCDVRCTSRQDGHFLTVAMGNGGTRPLLERAALFLGHSAIGILAATCDDVVWDNQEAATVTLTLERPLTETELQDLHRLLSVDDEVVQCFQAQENPQDSVEHLELKFAIARLIRSRLNQLEQYSLSLEEVLRILDRYDDVTRRVLLQILFRLGRVPEQPSIQFVPQRDTSQLTDRNVMQALMDLPANLQKCNLVQPARQCLAFRIASAYFCVQPDQPQPFGIFYVYGKGFDGFHVRFRDIARGGMRLVRTRNREHYLFESQRLYNEVYDLAWAQNLKNKDIPEGGSKAVVMLKPGTDPDFAGRRFVDGLLDLILPDLPTGDVSQTPEYLYLGPDENVAPHLINWIVENARNRGYAYFNTFISSKPMLGINHKEFGVTSEGVIVFLTQCLKEAGINPDTDSFTVKLTGGPDGDVGGNAIRFLIRDFGSRAKIVGIADGSGCATDPSGLDPVELMKLVDANLPISHFPANKLSAEGQSTGVDSFQDQSLRNNMHFRVPSDVFLPCGGRPGSINQFNVEMFFNDQGTAASRMIVEGANLFITPAARQVLSDRGVWVIKDSSANKCGVICSSLEIVAGMLLTDEQFLAIKPKYVVQVVQHLKSLAAREAVSLFQEQRRQPAASLPELSVQVSRMILRISDAIEEGMDDWSTAQWSAAEATIRQYLPPVLLETAGPSAWNQLPPAYQRQLISALLSSVLVYSEGCRNLELMKPSTWQELAKQQLESIATLAQSG